MHHSPPETARSISTSQLASQPAPSTDRCDFAPMTGYFPCTQERGRAMTEKGTGNIGFKTQACAAPLRVLELRREGRQMQHIVPRTNDTSKKMAIHNILNPTSSEDTSSTCASATPSITATEHNRGPPQVRKDNGAPAETVPRTTKSAFDNITPRNSAWNSKTPATCCKCTEGRKRGVWQPRWPGDTWA